METIKDYLVVVATSPEELTTKVVQRIKEGWQPTGGATASIGAVKQTKDGWIQNSTFQQAMVK